MPIISSETHHLANIVVSRTDARKAFGLADDPELEVESFVHDFWRTLAAEVAAVCPAFKMPSKFMLSSTSVFTSNKKVHVTFGADGGTERVWMSVNVHSQRSPRRWTKFVANRTQIDGSVPGMVWSPTDDELGMIGNITMPLAASSTTCFVNAMARLGVLLN